MKKGLSGTPVEFVFLTWWPFDKNFVDTNLDNVILIKQKCVLSFFWGRVWVQVLTGLSVPTTSWYPDH